ncbi:hypothetical protein [Candidatus Spongiihabitans sp.]
MPGPYYHWPGNPERRSRQRDTSAPQHDDEKTSAINTPPQIYVYNSY